MFTICGYNFCKDGNTLDAVPIHANSYTTTRISNGLFDNWWVSRDVSSEYSSTIPTTWDYLTVMNANFNGNINAGNIASTLSGIDGFKIKRRIIGTYDWVTLKFIDVSAISDLSFAFQDNLAASGVQYEYAFVPVTGGVDGDYSSSTIDTKFNGVFICDLDTIYRFYAGVSYGSQQRVQKVGTFEPFGRKYPVIVSNSVINYDTGSVSGTIMPPDYIDTHILDRHTMTQEQKQLLDFLTNKKAKMLKDYNGREWLMVITTNPSLSYSNNWGQGLADFTAQWEEIGDANKQSDLVSTGIISDDYTPSSVKTDIVNAAVTLGAQLSYTGQEQVQTISSVVYGANNLIANTDYAITGNVGTNAGIYTMTLTGIGKYRGTKTVQWTISKVAPTITLNPSSLDINVGSTATTAITTNSDGELSASLADTTKGTVVISNNTVTVTASASGSTVLTVSQAAGTNYSAGNANANVTISGAVMPVKGDLITMTLGNATPAAGTQDTYRVLSVDGNIAFVVAMFDQSTSTKFGSDNTYANSTLDTYLNTTWYNSLSSTAKSAIQATNITQYQYTYNGSVYNATTHASYADYSTKASKAVVGNRYVYALDVEDIETYFNSVFSTADIWTLFWNTTSQPSTITEPWLRSAGAGSSAPAWDVYGYYGNLRYDDTNTGFAARPAFKIDLSQISWQPYTTE